ncbi:MAG: hypothetical protein KDK91_03155 [Gammaproteobacteria bacterium]|nr:hypothetical protein [Gammaproteobacteria bacterium]
MLPRSLRTNFTLAALGLGVVMIAWSQSGLALDARTLRARIEAGTAGTIVDIRPTRDFDLSRIPGAINVPAAVVADRRFPPLGRVVIYGDALQPQQSEAALRAFARKPGLQPELLEGGYQAWIESGAVRSEATGVRKSRAQMLGYAELVELSRQPASVVLVDMREADERREKLGELSDLGDEFPAAGLVTPTAGTDPADPGARALLRASARQAAMDYPDATVVLIDAGGELAESIAHDLAGAGLARIAVLRGGELAVRSKGEATTMESVQ